MWQRLFLISILISLLSACGSEDTDTKPSKDLPDPIDKPNVVIPEQVNNLNSPLVIEGDSTSKVGKYVALVAYLEGDEVESYQWQQISGPTVNLSSYRQGVVTFIPEQIGVYEFEVTATDINGKEFQKSTLVNVEQGLGEGKELLRDRPIRGGRNFVIYFTENIDMSDLSIESSNDSVSVAINIDRKERKAYIRVPKVESTKLVTLELKQNQDIIDKAYILVEKNEPITSSYFCEGTGVYCATTEPLSRVFAYRPDSDYAHVLEECTFSNSLKRDNLCTVDKLPPLNMNSQGVTHKDILDRLLVNEEWMGKRFEDFLAEMDNNGDFERLFGSVTAVVISDNIKVPFYWALTGTIYLSPYDLYQGQIERLSLANIYDYHQYIARNTSVDFLWRYEKDKVDISLTDKANRNKEYIYLNLATLLYHELAHANDFYPYNQLSNMDKNKVLIDNIEDFSLMTSYQLGQQYPLTSQAIKSLAKYSFQGQTVSETIINKNPQIIADDFMNDSANDLYSYVNDREDMAMLFEETMMKFRFNLDRDVAIVDANTQKLIEGQRNRVFEDNVSQRALTVVQSILPENSEELLIFFNQHKSVQLGRVIN